MKFYEAKSKFFIVLKNEKMAENFHIVTKRFSLLRNEFKQKYIIGISCNNEISRFVRFENFRIVANSFPLSRNEFNQI
jgi:hypothetical protein